MLDEPEIRNGPVGSEPPDGAPRGFRGVGEALWNRRNDLAAARERLEALADAVGRPGDLDLAQYSHLFSAVLEFRPDLIIEVGRGYGNSTCVLTEAAGRLPDTSVVSLCLSNDWQERICAKVAQRVPAEWFRPLDAPIANLLETDVAALLKGRRRVMLLWDAHGWDVADYVLGVVLPLLREREHLVFVHDIVNTEFRPEVLAYGGLGIWREYPGDDKPLRRVVLGSMASPFEELIPLMDFASRNGMPLHSVEAEVRRDIDAFPDRRAAMSELGGRLGTAPSQFYWFRLDEIGGTPNFPTFVAKPPPPPPLPPPAPKPADVVAPCVRAFADDLGRYNLGGRATPLTYARIGLKLLLGRYRR